MVEFKNSTITVKAKGSDELSKSLLKGDVKKISEHFQLPYVQVSDYIRGRYNGPKEIIECAERIAAFYKDVDIDAKVKEIIESYERNS